MLAERVKDWTQGWKEEGRQEGREEGRWEEGVLLLRRQLTLRFGALPAWAEERLQNVDVPTLELWAERILTATTLEQVLKT